MTHDSIALFLISHSLSQLPGKVSMEASSVSTYFSCLSSLSVASTPVPWDINNLHHCVFTNNLRLIPTDVSVF